MFEKGYEPNWSEAVYKIYKIQSTSPVTYLIEDLLGEKIEGAFYEKELQKMKQKFFRIEKIIRKKKINGVEHGLVKWIGYSDKFNHVEPLSNLKFLSNI